jgi:hypothetical protein
MNFHKELEKLGLGGFPCFLCRLSEGVRGPHDPRYQDAREASGARPCQPDKVNAVCGISKIVLRLIRTKV